MKPVTSALLFITLGASCTEPSHETESTPDSGSTDVEPLLTDSMRELLSQVTSAPELGAFTPPQPRFPEGPDKIDRLRTYMESRPERLDDTYDVVVYAAEVEQELGRFESFSVFGEGSQIIPITRNGIEIEQGQHGPGDQCDRPPWLGVGPGGRAKPYARVGRLRALNSNGTDRQDVDWVFIARRYRFVSDPTDPLFSDVAIIGSHRTTGATAFFQMLSPDAPKNASSVPSPMDPDPSEQQRARDFWLTPRQAAGINCYECHTGDPWIHSPYIDQVTFVDQGVERPIIPRGVDLSAVPPYSPPYWFIGTQAFSEWPAPKHFAVANNLCVKCHRIGTERRGQFVALSTGRASAESQSDSFREYHHSHWMPPGVAGEFPKAQFEAIYGSSISQLLSYLQDPTQPGANPQPIGQE